MKKLTQKEQFEWFVDTLEMLSTILQVEESEELEYRVYENLDADIHSIFYD